MNYENDIIIKDKDVWRITQQKRAPYIEDEMNTWRFDTSLQIPPDKFNNVDHSVYPISKLKLEMTIQQIQRGEAEHTLTIFFSQTDTFVSVNIFLHKY